MKRLKINFDSKYVSIIMITALMLCSYMLGSSAGSVVASHKEEDRIVVAIDAGHGGNDPGKTVGEILEKDINLEIALLIRDLLIQKDIEVLLTREDDRGLYDENASNKKVSDMKKRCELINSQGVDVLVSIHQNSYSSPGVKGAQVFYYESSKEGKKLANLIQNSIKNMVDTENKRKEKADNSYYLLINANMPAVIVECGFLTNNAEREKLLSKSYQEKLAKAIVAGIEQFFEN